MFQPERLATIGFAARRRPNGLVASVMWIAGMIAAVAAMGVLAVPEDRDRLRVVVRGHAPEPRRLQRSLHRQAAVLAHR